MKWKASQKEIDLLLKIIDEAYEKKAWHGPNLRGSVRGVNAQQASWRPARGRHNIWEIVVHTAYWKYAVRRRLLREKRGSFPVKGSNWFTRPVQRTDKAWRKDVELLGVTHRALRAAFKSMSAQDFSKPSRTGKFSNLEMIYGIALHDVYHAGQIQLLKRLMRKK